MEFAIPVRARAVAACDACLLVDRAASHIHNTTSSSVLCNQHTGSLTRSLPQTDKTELLTESSPRVFYVHEETDFAAMAPFDVEAAIESGLISD